MTKENVFIIAERDGYAPKMGVLVSQLQNARHYLKAAVKNASQEQLEQKPVNLTLTQLKPFCKAAKFFRDSWWEMAHNLSGRMLFYRACLISLVASAIKLSQSKLGKQPSEKSCIQIKA